MKPTTSIPRESMPFMDETRQLDETGRTDDALDLLFDAIDEMMWNDRFGELDSLIAGLDASEYSIDVLLGVLTATLPAKERLPARPKLYEDIETVLDRRDQLEDGLLAGLE